MIYRIITPTKDIPFEDWLEYRKQGIGGSDASVVCGINRYKSPIELWMEKTNQLPHQEAGEAAYWGNQLESLVREEFTKRTGIEVIHPMQLLQNVEHPFMQANLDGICQHPELGPCIFEAKTASAYKANKWDNTIPDEYMLQLQHYMAVTGYKGSYIAALIGGNTFRWKFIERDEALIALLIQLEKNSGPMCRNLPHPSWTAPAHPQSSLRHDSRTAHPNQKSNYQTLPPIYSTSMTLPVSRLKRQQSKSKRQRIY